MPTTETPKAGPTPEPGTPDPVQSNAAPPDASKPGPGFEFGTSRTKGKYTSLGTHELVTLVEDLEDDRARARVREGIWVSVIIHLLIFWFIAYGPQVIFHHPRVVNPADILAKKDSQFLDLPPDLLQHVKPKPTNILSDKDRVAQTKTPSLDKKTLQQLEAMKPAGPPAPQPGAQQQPAPTPQASQQPPAQQQGQQPEQQAKQEPQPPAPAPQPQASLEQPRPAPTTPNFRAGGSIGDQIRNDARAAARGGPIGGGDMGMSAPSRHPGNMGGMEILSDTMGVDFGPYMARLKYIIEHTWWPIIPEEAMPPLSKKGVTIIRFKIGPDGTLESMTLEGRSGTVSLDRAAWGAIKGSQPLPPLPKTFKGPFLEIRGGFLYNLQPDDLK
jgi:TonB family protein